MQPGARKQSQDRETGHRRNLREAFYAAPANVDRCGEGSHATAAPKASVVDRALSSKQTV